MQLKQAPNPEPATDKLPSPAFAKTVPAQAYIGISIIGAELEGKRADSGSIKQNYSKFISFAVGALKGSGHAPPKSMQEFTRLAEDAHLLIWCNFKYKPTHGLSEAFSRPQEKFNAKPGGKKSSSLDCDTCSLVLAEILNSFGVKSSLTIISDGSEQGHAALRVDTKSDSIYIETTQAPYSQERGICKGSREFNSTYPAKTQIASIPFQSWPDFKRGSYSTSMGRPERNDF